MLAYYNSIIQFITIIGRFVMRNKASNIVWGLVLIAIGVGIAGDIMDLWVFRVFFPGGGPFLS